ncbi:hypothetical protein SAMN05444481_117102 [Flavobacterium frigidimaris]|nr:hypothetical protein SAMN05444481_117102 [Flavobacterium frigidimaris]
MFFKTDSVDTQIKSLREYFFTQIKQILDEIIEIKRFF